MKWPCLQRLSDHFGAPSLLCILYLSAQILRRISCLLAKHGMTSPQEFSITSLKSCAKLTAPHVATHKLGGFRNTIVLPIARNAKTFCLGKINTKTHKIKLA